MIHREISRVLVLHLLWLPRGAKNTERHICVLTTPSFLSRGTRCRTERLLGFEHDGGEQVGVALGYRQGIEGVAHQRVLFAGGALRGPEAVERGAIGKNVGDADDARAGRVHHWLVERVRENVARGDLLFENRLDGILEEPDEILRAAFL